MRVRVSHLTRRSKGGVSRREQSAEASVARIGRDAAAEIFLPDPRVLLRHATIEPTPDGKLIVRALGNATLGVDGSVAASAAIAPGSKITIGPYRLEIEQPREDADLALTVELVEPLGGGPRHEQGLGTKGGLTEILPAKRLWSWVLFTTIALLFLVLPVAANLMSRTVASTKVGPVGLFTAWNIGTISNPHRAFADNCDTCHQKPFVRVENAACLNCHADEIGQHADPRSFPAADLANQRCESCHKEHSGQRMVARNADRFCATCHASIETAFVGSRLLNVASFGHAHPEFRPSVTADPAKGDVARVSLGAVPRPRDNPGLRFPHSKHLAPAGLRTVLGVVKLDCADCHRPSTGGIGFVPITYEATCQSCHQLKFEPKYPDWEVPHAVPAMVRRTIEGLYSQIALTEKRDLGPPEPLVQKPGQLREVPRSYSEEGMNWARARALEAMTSTFGANGCGYCHAVTPPPTGGDAMDWKVVPARLQPSFLPKARFNHAKHTTVGCADCHDAARSEESAELLLPGIETCRNCHSGEEPDRGRVASACVACHGFHDSSSKLGKRSGKIVGVSR
ncbi:MAG: cytochrome c3 family protein [Proteobacteria bacterium]|nr:cytochrome c3 family protein [Pseudomonadota bacterium]